MEKRDLEIIEAAKAAVAGLKDRHAANLAAIGAAAEKRRADLAARHAAEIAPLQARYAATKAALEAFGR
jgi:hypothetical protein